MSGLRVNALRGETVGSSPTFPDGVSASGVITATNFSGNLTGNVTGNITGTTGTFSDNVSVGGTLTYEDVTNIDSVGVITARSGIKVGSGQSVSAVSGTISYYGDGSKLTGVESGVGNFVASGNIANGQTLIINSDGTVGIVTGSTSYAGTPVVFDSEVNSNSYKIVYDTVNNKVIIVYKDVSNSNYGTAVVGTVSGTSITFGSPVVFASTAVYSEPLGCVHDPDQEKIIITYRDNNNSSYGTAVVGTVSGTSITFGSSNVFNSANTPYSSLVYDTNSNKVVISYGDFGSSQGKSIVGTVSGNSISFGSPVTFDSNGSTYYVSSTFDSTNNKVIIAYQDSGDSGKGKAVVGTVSGTSISFGSQATFESGPGEVWYVSCEYDSTNDKVIIIYQDDGNSNLGTVVVGTVSGTSISFGTPSIFSTSSVYYSSVTHDVTNNKIVVSYKEAGDDNKLRIRFGTVSGTDISFGTAYNLGTSADWMDSVFDPDNSKVILVYRYVYGRAVVVNVAGDITTNLNTTNYIGIAAESIADGATGKVSIMGGVNTGQTGLTTAKTHYIQSDGTLSTSAGSPAVPAGTAISSTDIIVWKS